MGRWYAAASHATHDLTYNPLSLRYVLGLVTMTGLCPGRGTQSSVAVWYFLSALGAPRNTVSWQTAHLCHAHRVREQKKSLTLA